MAEEKHTPKPWKVVKRKTSGAAGFEIRFSEEGECITDHVYQEVDAHLMAAAPELLEVAKGYEEWEADLVMLADWTSATPVMLQRQFDRLMELQTMRNSALKKAGGL